VESPPATPLLQAPGEVKYPSIWTNGPLQANGDSGDVGTSDPSFGWYYCQEFDCEKGFSSEAHLESHVRLFHRMKPAKASEEEKEVTPFSSYTPENAEQSMGHSPVYLTQTVSPSGSGEHTMQDIPHLPSPVESSTSVLPQEGHQVIHSSAGMGVQDTSGSLADSLTTTHGEVGALPAVTTSASLSLQCRMCDAPPTIDMRPTATMCGHVFCYKCITQRVMTTPSCPVCDGALLLYCLFKLDLPVLP